MNYKRCKYTKRDDGYLCTVTFISDQFRSKDSSLHELGFTHKFHTVKYPKAKDWERGLQAIRSVVLTECRENIVNGEEVFDNQKITWIKPKHVHTDVSVEKSA